MPPSPSLIQNAQALSFTMRKEIIASMPEVELHSCIERLLMEMDPNSLIEVTHGKDEYGKDLVMVRRDAFDQTVIAIVVKRGDIRGKTKGTIDEIKSQIDQAVRHPAKLKTITQPLSVSKVWVMLAGELGTNARERLLQEVSFRDVTSFDLKWLVERFTEFYPQVFFEGKVMDFLQSQIQKFETKHMFSSRGKNLSDCFIDPSVTAISFPKHFNVEDIKESVRTIVQHTRKKQLPFVSLRSLIDRGKHIILAGEPGTGKSLALSKIAVDLYKDSAKEITKGNPHRQIDVPVLLAASKLLDYQNENELLQDYISDSSIRERYRIKVLLIDGLDEAPAEDRQAVIGHAKKIADDLKCSLIVTTRPIDLVRTTPTGFEQYELLPFDMSQAISLFNRFIDNTQILQALQEGMQQFRSHITMTPLSLLMLIETVERHSEVPASITELYDRYSDEILGRYDRDRGITVLFEYLVKKRFLAWIAYYEFYCKNRLEIPLQEFNKSVHEYIATYQSEVDEERGAQFISEIERSGVILCRDTVSFRHRSFLDYFIAQYIFDRREDFGDLESLVTGVYFDTLWSDVAFFYSGLKREIPLSLLHKILDSPSENLESSIYKFTTGRLLQAAWHSPQLTKREGVRKTAEIAYSLREQLLNVTKALEDKVPEIFSDILVLFLAETSLRSMFLANELKLEIHQLQEESTRESLYGAMTLLWTAQKFLSEQEVTNIMGKMLDAVKSSNLSSKDEGIIICLLTAIENNDSTTVKAVGRHFERLKRRHPKAFQELLPVKRQGFR
jgi:hypothetical protein